MRTVIIYSLNFILYIEKRVCETFSVNREITGLL